jgi:hypothetical protein
MRSPEPGGTQVYVTGVPFAAQERSDASLTEACAR